ncbi:MAG: hypothetical protein Q8Q08_12970 [Candidatus Omnitrophota bacterium]|nr:hypothetical protein [Candidatus Omnitrophota bacterium]
MKNDDTKVINAIAQLSRAIDELEDIAFGEYPRDVMDKLIKSFQGMRDIRSDLKLAKEVIDLHRA